MRDRCRRSSTRAVRGIDSEIGAQIALVDWIMLTYPHLMFCHVPNWHGGRSMGAIMQLKRMGVRAGAPDLLFFDSVVIPEPLDRGMVIIMNGPGYKPIEVRPGRYKGLAIEMKARSVHKVSPEQEATQNCLAARGWLVTVCAGFDEAKAVVDVAYGSYQGEKREIQA